MSLEAEFKATLIKNDVKHARVATLRIVSGREHGLVSKSRTLSDDIHIIESFLILSEMRISLGTVEDKFSPADDGRRTEVRELAFLT